MTPIWSLHNHTVFCDGKNTVDEMVRSAISKDFAAIGFSAHSPLIYDDGWCMAEENIPIYRTAVDEAKTRYAGKIKVLCGVEQDFYSGRAHAGWDYVIGSVHGVVKNGAYLSVDESKDAFIRYVRDNYDGDGLAFAEDYYALMEQVVEVTGCSIIGHFDLVVKYNADGSLFNVRDPRYIAASRRAAEKLAAYGIPFEVNTGAVARGYTAEPYPSRELMEYIASLGGKFIVTTDCHNIDLIDFGIAEAKALIAEIGGEEVTEI